MIEPGGTRREGHSRTAPSTQNGPAVLEPPLSSRLGSVDTKEDDEASVEPGTSGITVTQGYEPRRVARRAARGAAL